ncbi:type II methionyl aminopeptidase [Nanoarchaeota archaeon]|nr:MAG: type II methionyl aminopeptidase [Nanoarchaeota archaeon]
MDEEIINNYKEAGKIAVRMLSRAREIVKPGVKYTKVVEELEKFYEEAKPAFPINISVNSIAAHDTPKINDERSFEKGDMVKVDVGVHVNGYIADTAITVDLGDNSDLVKASKEALSAAIDTIKPGVNTRDVGEAIENVIKSYGFMPIINLTGHELKKYELHAGLNIPNTKTREQNTIHEGAYAIEPFTTNGAGYVVETKSSEIFSLSSGANPRRQKARQVLKWIEEEYKTLPFAKRWIIQKFGPVEGSLSINELVKTGSLHNYPILREGSNGLVAQTEKTIIVLDSGNIVTTSF